METITADEWCAIARTSRFTVYRHLRAKLIPAFQSGDSWRIPTRWARVQLGEIDDPAYTKLEAGQQAEAEPDPEQKPKKRGRSVRRTAGSEAA
jgi:hypothetical protein